MTTFLKSIEWVVMFASMSHKQTKLFSLLEAFAPFFISMLFLSGTAYWMKDASEGGYQLSLLMGTVVAVAIGWRHKISLSMVWQRILGNIKSLFPTLLFLLLIGAISTLWLVSGVIPSMIFYGITYMHPVIFLPTAALFTGFMGLACGSSWLTIGTMGVAFLGIGETLGFPMPLVAGAVISGAYFGDKLTPLSETTVLAASMTKTPLMGHVRYMLWTSIPAFLFTLLLFTCVGYCYYVPGSEASSNCEQVKMFLDNNFRIRVLYLLLPLAVMGLTFLGLPPLIILGLGALIGGVIALFDQTHLLLHIIKINDKPVDEGGLVGAIPVLLRNTFFGVAIPNEDSMLLHPLNAGGILGMWSTISIIITSVLLSGAMEGTGLLASLISRITQVKSNLRLVLLTLATGIFFNFAVADQYLAIILASKIFTPLFLQRGLASENVSRAVEDAATVTSPLVPWNTCGVMQSKVLGVPTISYLPFCFFNILSPLATILIHALGFKVAVAYLPESKPNRIVRLRKQPEKK